MVRLKRKNDPAKALFPKESRLPRTSFDRYKNLAEKLRSEPEKEHGITELANMAGVIREDVQFLTIRRKGEEPKIPWHKNGSRCLIFGKDAAFALKRLGSIPENGVPMRRIAKLVDRHQNVCRGLHVIPLEDGSYFEYIHSTNVRILIPLYSNPFNGHLTMELEHFEAMKRDHELKKELIAPDEVAEILGITEKALTHKLDYENDLMNWILPNGTAYKVLFQRIEGGKVRFVREKIEKLASLIDTISRNIVIGREMARELSITKEWFSRMCKECGHVFKFRLDGRDYEMRIIKPRKNLEYTVRRTFERFREYYWLKHGKTAGYYLDVLKIFNIQERKYLYEARKRLGDETFIVLSENARIMVKLIQVDDDFYISKDSEDVIRLFLAIKSNEFIRILDCARALKEEEFRRNPRKVLVQLWLLKEPYMEGGELMNILDPIMMQGWVETAFDSNVSEKIAFDGIREF